MGRIIRFYAVLTNVVAIFVFLKIANGVYWNPRMPYGEIVLIDTFVVCIYLLVVTLCYIGCERNLARYRAEIRNLRQQLKEGNKENISKKIIKNEKITSIQSGNEKTGNEKTGNEKSSNDAMSESDDSNKNIIYLSETSYDPVTDEEIEEGGYSFLDRLLKYLRLPDDDNDDDYGEF